MAADEQLVRCHAPFTSLYLDPRGFARVCAVNNDVPLGNVGRESILDIWQGAQAERLRSAFRSGAWGPGCEVCEWQATTPGPDRSFARVFDQFAGSHTEPQWPKHIEFALGNTCNLRCIMCSGDLSSSIRSRHEGFEPLPEIYDDRFFADLEVLAPHLEVAKFLGGEPFMVPAHHRVWDLLADGASRPAVHVTTNGTLWNDRVESVLDRFDTGIAISMDGIRPGTVERIRAGADFDTLRANVDRFLAYTHERGTHFGLTYCLMTENWDEFGDFLAFADGLDVEVFVNVVTMPSRFSLLRLPPAELRQVVDTMIAQHGEGGLGLGQNQSVWVDQIRQLQARLIPSADATSVGWWATTASRLEVTEPAGADDLAELEHWSQGGPIVLLELDDHDEVCSATPSDRFLDLPLDAGGRRFDELIVLLGSYYGRRTDIGWVRHRGGLEDRTARYETASGVTDLRSITRRAAPDRLRMALAARRGPVVGQPVAVMSARSATAS